MQVEAQLGTEGVIKDPDIVAEVGSRTVEG